MSPKDFVLAKYPSAHARYNKPLADVDLPRDREGHWSIYLFPELGTRLLGRGATEEEAWQNAAAMVRGEEDAEAKKQQAMLPLLNPLTGGKIMSVEEMKALEPLLAEFKKRKAEEGSQEDEAGS